MTDQSEQELTEATQAGMAKKIEATGWGAFFVWVGIVLLAEVPAGWALAVVGLITLAGQVARVVFGLRTEVFWLVVGTCFLLGGIWELIEAQIHLFPVLLIAGGLAVILASFWPKGWKRKHA